MPVHGVLADDESFRDLPVREALCKQAEDLSLAARELGERRAGSFGPFEDAPRAIGVDAAPSSRKPVRAAVASRLAASGLPAAARARREREACLRRLERLAALLEPVDVRPRAGAVHARARRALAASTPAARSAAARSSGVPAARSTSRRSVERGGRLVEPAARGLCVDEELERRGAVEPAPRVDAAEQSLEDLDRVGGVALAERDPCPAELRFA